MRLLFVLTFTFLFLFSAFAQEGKNNLNWDKFEKTLYQKIKKEGGRSEAEIHEIMGYVLLSNGNHWKRAIVHFKKAVSLDPLRYLSWYNLGLIYIGTGEGNNYFKKAIEAKPDFAPPYYWLAYTYCGMGKNKEAVSVFEKYLKVAKGNPKEVNRVKEAEKLLEELHSGKEGKELSKIRQSF